MESYGQPAGRCFWRPAAVRFPRAFQVMLMTDAKIHQAPHDAVLSFVSIVPASIAACCLGMQAGLRQPPPLKPPPASVESLGCDSGRRRLELE